MTIFSLLKILFYNFLFILHIDYSFPSLPYSLFSIYPLTIHSSSISIEKGADLLK